MKRLPNVLCVTWVLLLVQVFANVEIQIGGQNGWATMLPTWRIQDHCLLDIFWGRRDMAGYHAWMFPCIALVFHFPFFLIRQWNWRLECRVVACIALFQIVEDFLWFALNPAFGLSRFAPERIPWHKHQIAFAPFDYWLYTGVALVLFHVSADPVAERPNGRHECST